jgi:hypothetical protein
MAGATSAVEVVTQAYEAFGRGDVPGILACVADQVDWRFCGPKGLPYTGTFRTRDEVARWFSYVAAVDDVRKFEPREFIPAGDKLTVLGWEQTAAKPGGRVFESEWVHVFTVRDGRIVRFWGMYDNEASGAARQK